MRTEGGNMEVKHIARPVVVTLAAGALLVGGCKKKSPSADASPDPLNSLTTANIRHRPTGHEIAARAPLLIEQLKTFPDSYNYGDTGLNEGAIIKLRQHEHLNPQQKEKIQNNLIILTHALSVGDVNVKKAALRQLGRMNEYGEAAVPAICKALSDSNLEVRMEAAEALEDMYCADCASAAEVLAAAALVSTGEFQREVSYALRSVARDVETPSVELMEHVIELLDAENEWVQVNAVAVLEDLAKKGNAQGALPKLVELAESGHRLVRDEAIEVAADIDPQGFPLSTLAKLLDESLEHNCYGDINREAAFLAAKLGPAALPLRPRLIALLFDERGTKFWVPDAVGRALHAIDPEEDYSRELINRSYSCPFPIKCSVGIALAQGEGPNRLAGVRLLEMVYYSELANQDSRKRAAQALADLREKAVGVVQPKTLIDIANKVGLEDVFNDRFSDDALRTLEFYGPELKTWLHEIELMAGLQGKGYVGGFKQQAAGGVLSSLLEKVQGKPEHEDLQKQLEHDISVLVTLMPRWSVSSMLEAIEEKHPQLLTDSTVEHVRWAYKTWLESYFQRFPSNALKASLQDAVSLVAHS